MNYAFYLSELYYEALLITCFFTGCLFLRKSFPLEYKLLVVLSGLTLLVESAVMYFLIFKTAKPWIYDFFGPVECGFIVYILYRVSLSRVIKRLNIFLLVLLPVGVGICHMLPPLLPWVNEPAIFYCLFTNLVAACSYLIDLLLNKADIPLIRYPFFWMASGELIFCCVYAMIPPLLNYYMKISYTYFMVYSLVANTFMYGGFIACFYCFRRARSLASLRLAR